MHRRLVLITKVLLYCYLIWKYNTVDTIFSKTIVTVLVLCTNWNSSCYKIYRPYYWLDIKHSRVNFRIISCRHDFTWAPTFLFLSPDFYHSGNIWYFSFNKIHISLKVQPFQLKWLRSNRSDFKIVKSTMTQTFVKGVKRSPRVTYSVTADICFIIRVKRQPKKWLKHSLILVCHRLLICKIYCRLLIALYPGTHQWNIKALWTFLVYGTPQTYLCVI